jgi:hypothetical protein
MTKKNFPRFQTCKTFYGHILQMLLLDQIVSPLQAFPSLMLPTKAEAYLCDALFGLLLHSRVGYWP